MASDLCSLEAAKLEHDLLAVFDKENVSALVVPETELLPVADYLHAQPNLVATLFGFVAVVDGHVEVVLLSGTGSHNVSKH